MGQPGLQGVLAMLRLLNVDDIAANLDAIGTFFAEDVTYQPLAPLSRVFRGKAAIVEELGRHALRYRNCVCDVKAAAASEDRVFTERVDTVTLLADGRSTVVHVTGVFEIDAAGLIRAWREYWDPVSAARQMNVSAEDILVALGAQPGATTVSVTNASEGSARVGTSSGSKVSAS